MSPRLRLTLITRSCLVALLLLSLASNHVSAADSWPVFPSAELHEQGAQYQRDFEFPLGAIRREMDGHIGPNPSQRISGEQEARTYQVKGGYDTEEIFAFHEEELLRRGYQINFRCDSFQCGRSSFWANNYFGVANLFGPDRNQHMIAATATDTGNDTKHYRVIYVVERANRRVYYHVTHLKVSAAKQNELPSTALLVQTLDEVGRVALPGLRFTPDGELDMPTDDANLVLVREVLAATSTRRRVLVGHNRGTEGSLDERVAQSRKLAGALKTALGDTASTISVRGVGPLAPNPLADGPHWVELVILE